MSFLGDFLPVLKKHTITFSGSREEVGDIKSFAFTPDGPMPWKAGQHGILSFQGRLEGGSWRGFSIASDPDSGHILVTTRITERPSAFKRALMGLKPGDKVSLRGPFGPFYLDGTRRPAVFIAGGIGITPYRSLIMHSLANLGTAPESMLLLYADDRNEYAYRAELDEAVASGRLGVEYLDSGTLADRITAAVDRYGGGALYFISGPPKMVSSVRKTLAGLGVPKRNTRFEPFLGL